MREKSLNLESITSFTNTEVATSVSDKVIFSTNLEFGKNLGEILLGLRELLFTSLTTRRNGLAAQV